MSVLGLDSGYTVKYNPLPSGAPSGFALGNSFRQRVIFDRISFVSSSYGYNNHLKKLYVLLYAAKYCYILLDTARNWYTYTARFCKYLIGGSGSVVNLVIAL